MALWTVEMFGALRLSQGKQEITRLRTRKTEALLAYLVLFSKTAHAREALAALLWPDVDPKAARNSLSVALNALRAVLEPKDRQNPPVLLADTTHLRLDFTLLSCDVTRFNQTLQEAKATADEDRKLSLLQEAIALYRGPLLPALYEPWILEERERLERLLHEGLRQITRLLVNRKTYRSALDYALWAAKLDPLHDADCRNVMRLHTAMGNPQEALSHYRNFARRLQDETNSLPAAETIALAEQITPHLAERAERKTASSSTLGAIETAPLDRFFGRETERETLERWLQEDYATSESALITLTGMGGIGKTRLAREVVKNLLPVFGRRIHFIPLADITEPAFLFEAICHALHLPRAAEITPLEQLAGVFEDKPFLLLLDNFEQLAVGGDMQVQALRQRLPAMTLLITSRQRLNVAGEREFMLSPLPTPQLSGTPERMEDFACVRLFVDRCRQRDADFELTTENVETVAQICAHLEGVPLALELAAGWSRALTPAQMLARLEKPFDLLVSNRRDLPQRHRSLRAVLEGSYRLLSPAQQSFFARLSVFGGGWTLEAAEAVCGGKTLEMLTALQDASLIVQVISQEMGEMRRFRFLETLREFAAEYLTEAERATATQRYASYFLELAEQGKQALKGSGIAERAELLAVENDNFSTILALCFPEVVGNPPPSIILPVEQGVRLTASLLRFWHLRGHMPEVMRWVAAAFAACDKIAPADCLVLYWELPDYVEPTPQVLKAGYSECALRLADTLPEPFLKAIARLARAQAIFHDDKAGASRDLEEAIALFRKENAPRLLGYALSLLGICYNFLEGQDARSAFEEAIALLRESGDILWLSTALCEFAFYVLAPEQAEQAEALLEEALALYAQIKHSHGRAHGLWILGKTLRLRDLEGAEVCFQESLALHRRYGFQHSMTLPLYELGYTALLKKDYRAARAYFLQWHAGRPEFNAQLQELLMICSLGERDDTAFRYHCENRLHLAEGSLGPLVYVRQMQGFDALLKNDFVTARALSAQVAALFAQDAHLRPQCLSYLCTARLLAEQGLFQIASRLLGAGIAALKEEKASPLPFVEQIITQTETLLRASLGETAFLQDYEAGKALNAQVRKELLLSLLTLFALPAASSLPI